MELHDWWPLAFRGAYRAWGLAALVAGGSSVIGWQIWQQYIAQELATQSASEIHLEITTVTALGRLEPEGERIKLTAPTGSQENRIDQLLVEQGDFIRQGQVVAILDSYAPRSAALQSAREGVAVAQAQFAQVSAGAQAGEIQAQQAEIARLQAELVGGENTQRAAISRLQAELQNARNDWQRYEALYSAGAISAAERDTRQLTHVTAQRQVQEAEATLSRTQAAGQQQLNQARANLDRIAEVRPVDIAAAQAQVQAAMATVAQAEAELEQTYVRAPRSGQVLKIHTRPGETIGSDGIVTLGQTQQMMVIAEVYQNDVASIEAGQSAVITSTALVMPLEGTVERIGLQVGQQQVVDEDPAANVDARVVEVYLRLAPDSSQLVMGLTNLQVTVTIQTKQ